MDLQTRAKNIILQPAQEWRVVDGESSDVASLIRDYAAPLSAIPAICGWLGMSVIGSGGYRTGLVRGLTSGIVQWVFGLVGCWLAALVIEKLAPSFGSRGSTAQALKLVVYAATPAWIAGVLDLVPPLVPLALIAALYALYLFYIGLPIVMKTPGDKVVPYMIASAVVIVVVFICASYVTTLLTNPGARMI